MRKGTKVRKKEIRKKKIHKKKISSLMLAFALGVGLLSGCGSASDIMDKSDIADDGNTVDDGVEYGNGETGDETISDSGVINNDKAEYEDHTKNDNGVTNSELDMQSSANMPAEAAEGEAVPSDNQSLSGGLENAQRKMESAENGAYKEAFAEDMSDSVASKDYGICAAEPNSEEYGETDEQGFMSAAANPLSTFSADVDTASYSNLRRMIEGGYSMEDIPEGAVRIEELLNYFDYDYTKPKNDEPFGVTTQIADCPWNENSKIAMIGLKTKDVDFSEAEDSNLVFLIDVSGSMYDSDKLPLLQKSFSLLTENLTAKDKVSIVVYASDERVVIEGVNGSEHKKILDAVNSLEADGSTNGSSGIITAYEIAEKYFIKGGNNRVILATDGDLNVGLTTEEELEDLITEKRKSGVYLSVLGFGTGNIKDNKMEILADKGNGNYSYIDSLTEAKKVLVEEMGATLVTVAEDVKFQVEFNPKAVSGYRLIGYDNRQLAERDFEDDTKDAGEVGAGHTVTVLYEIVTVDSNSTYSGSTLKYAKPKQLAGNIEWFTVNIRYKKPGETKSRLLTYPVDESSYYKEPNNDMRFAMAVAEFGLVVNDSDYKGNLNLRNVIDELKNIDTKADEYKDEFCYLVRRLEKNE